MLQWLENIKKKLKCNYRLIFAYKSSLCIILKFSYTREKLPINVYACFITYFVHLISYQCASAHTLKEMSINLMLCSHRVRTFVSTIYTHSFNLPKSCKNAYPLLSNTSLIPGHHDKLTTSVVCPLAWYNNTPFPKSIILLLFYMSGMKFFKFYITVLEHNTQHIKSHYRLIA